MTKSIFAVVTLIVLAATSGALSAQEYNPEIDKKALRQALDKYSSCTEDCAAALAQMIMDEGAAVVLGGFGAMKAEKSSTVPKSVKAIGWYAYLRHVYESGKKIVGNNAACYQSCDALNSEIVRLGRAGLLGPMLNDEEINPEALGNSEVFEAFIKFVKPIQVPAEHRSKEWWDLVRSTA